MFVVAVGLYVERRPVFGLYEVAMVVGCRKSLTLLRDVIFGSTALLTSDSLALEAAEVEKGMGDVALGSSIVVAPAVAGFEIASRLCHWLPGERADVPREGGVLLALVASTVDVASRSYRSGSRVHVF